MPSLIIDRASEQLRKGFHFKHFNFGHGIPDLHGLEVWEAPCRDQDAKRQGFEIHVSFKLQQRGCTETPQMLIFFVGVARAS